MIGWDQVRCYALEPVTHPAALAYLTPWAVMVEALLAGAVDPPPKGMELQAAPILTLPRMEREEIEERGGNALLSGGGGGR